MLKKKLILVGAGGHAKSVVDSINELEYELCGFIDSNKEGTHIGLPIFGAELDDIKNYEKFSYFVSIGDIMCRKAWFEKIKERKLNIINIVDKTALISSTAMIGVGNFIGKYAIINADSIIGDNNIINTKSLIEHECKIANNCHISTNSVINGNVVVENNVFLGSGSVCNGQLKIGSDSIVGSGSVVIKDVPEKVTVVGVPAKIIKRRD